MSTRRLPSMTRAAGRPAWLPPAVSDQALTDVHNHYPGLVLRRLLHTTGKAVLVAADYHGSASVLKILTAGDARWQRHHDAEARAYTRFAADPPPVRTPRLLAPPTPGLLLIEHLPGNPAATSRYPKNITPPILESVLTAANALATWPGATTFAADHRRPPLTPSDLATAAEIGAPTSTLQDWAATFTSTPHVFSHGDLLLTNTLTTDTEAALLDWEYAGLRLPGYDHALLWLTHMDHPAAQAHITAHATDHTAFRFNIAALLLRELRIHRDATSIPQVADRYRALRRLADDVLLTGPPARNGP
ncbi:phosphotransferase [Pseudofrankia saprophytica]|uniref:phosphotransferase n=1 Tax=Pseudofrankia saprophytica TaxID=298655 RepID=UPI000234BBE4|nr:phosphotransferase [Pseudofrankia saprophytica]